MANMRIETEPVAQDLFVAAQHADFGQQAIGKLIQDYVGYRNLYEREGASITAKDCLRQIRDLQFTAAHCPCRSKTLFFRRRRYVTFLFLNKS